MNFGIFLNPGVYHSNMKAMNLNDFKIEKNSLQFVKQSIKKKAQNTF